MLLRRYVAEKTYTTKVTYSKRPLIKSIEPALLWRGIDSIKITSDFLPLRLTTGTIKIDGVTVQEIGRFQGGGNDTVRVILKPGEEIRPGRKAVRLRSILAQQELIYYAFAIRPTSSDGLKDQIPTGGAKRFEVVVTPRQYDELSIDWDVTDDVSGRSGRCDRFAG